MKFKNRLACLFFAFVLVILLQCARQNSEDPNPANDPEISVRAETSEVFLPTENRNFASPLIALIPSALSRKYPFAQEELEIIEPEARAMAHEPTFLERDETDFGYRADALENSEPRSLFNSFGVTMDTFGDSSSARSILVQNDGKVIQGGYSYRRSTKTANFLLTRYHPDGSLDTSFNGVGSTSVHIGAGFDDLIHAIGTDSQGRIVATGRAHFGNSAGKGYYQWGLARFQTDGTLDATAFNPGGSVPGSVVSVFNSFNSVPRALVIQPDDKIVTVGYTATTPTNLNYAVAVARYNTDGSLDTSFASTGQVITKVITSDNVAYGAAIQTDGRIIAVGYVNNGTIQSLMVRYNTNGSLDNSFNGTGINTTNMGSGANLFNGVAVQANGRIVAAGYAFNGANNDYAVARYTNTGTLDTSFATGKGFSGYNFQGTDDYGHAVAITVDQKIIVVGKTLNGTRDAFSILRLTSTGALDSVGAGGTSLTTGSQFNSNGRFVSSVSAGAPVFDQGLAVAVKEGGIWVAGRTFDTSTGSTTNGLLRLNTRSRTALELRAPSGMSDTSFNVLSTIGVTLVSLSSFSNSARASTIQPDGKIVVAGIVLRSNDDFGVTRLNSDGSIDTNFGVNGRFTTSFPRTPSTGGALMTDDANAVLLQPDGRIVAVGVSFQSSADFAFLRLTPNGAIDSSFGANGFVTTSFPRGAIPSNTDEAFAAVLQPNGRIVAAGRTMQSNFDFGLVRLTTTGALDASFGTAGTGVVATSFPRVGGAGGLGNVDEAYALALQNDGKIIAGGRSMQSSFNFAMIRYATTGAIDSSFGNNGFVTTTFPRAGTVLNTSHEIYALALQTDGRIIAAGRSFQTNYTVALARYTTTGAIDSSFGNNGLVLSTWTFNSSDVVQGLMIQPNGKIVAVGNSGAQGFIARYLQDGRLDSSLDGLGRVLTSFAAGNDDFRAVNLATDGKIVVTGRSAFGLGEFAVLRVWP